MNTLIIFIMGFLMGWFAGMIGAMKVLISRVEFETCDPIIKELLSNRHGKQRKAEP